MTIMYPLAGFVSKSQENHNFEVVKIGICISVRAATLIFVSPPPYTDSLVAGTNIYNISAHIIWDKFENYVYKSNKRNGDNSGFLSKTEAV